MISDTFRLTSANEPGEWSVRYTDSETSSEFAENSVRTIQYTGYEERAS